MEVIIDGIVYVPKKKSELDLLKEKYESRDYIIVVRNNMTDFRWAKLNRMPSWIQGADYKLIHKKHKDILDAYLADNSVEIEYHIERDLWAIDKNFIDKYKEDCEYRLKQQYPIFKRNEDGEVFRFEDSSSYPLAVISNYRIDKYTSDNHNDWSTTPYDKEKGLYHLQPVWRYNNQNEVTIDFYSKEVSALLRTEAYKKVEPITPEQLETMPFIWDMYQQVLKDKQ